MAKIWFCNVTWGVCSERSKLENGSNLAHKCTDMLDKSSKHTSHRCAYCGQQRRA